VYLFKERTPINIISQTTPQEAIYASTNIPYSMPRGSKKQTKKKYSSREQSDTSLMLKSPTNEESTSSHSTENTGAILSDFQETQHYSDEQLAKDLHKLQKMATRIRKTIGGGKQKLRLQNRQHRQTFEHSDSEHSSLSSVNIFTPYSSKKKKAKAGYITPPIIESNLSERNSPSKSRMSDIEYHSVDYSSQHEKTPPTKKQHVVLKVTPNQQHTIRAGLKDNTPHKSSFSSLGNLPGFNRARTPMGASLTKPFWIPDELALPENKQQEIIQRINVSDSEIRSDKDELAYPVIVPTGNTPPPEDKKEQFPQKKQKKDNEKKQNK